MMANIILLIATIDKQSNMPTIFLPGHYGKDEFRKLVERN